MIFDAQKRRLFRDKKSITTDNLLPWIKDPQHFISSCTQCAECINCCPEEIIIKGDGGFPTINFDFGECSFCGQCAEVCKEPIFTSTQDPPWRKKAVIDNNCLAVKSIYCRSCAESCDFQALSFHLGISAVPKINNDLCTGCGACVSPCPTKAISVKDLK